MAGNLSGKGKMLRYTERKSGIRTAFRGIGIIEGSPEKLVGVINNPKRWKFWIDDLDEGKLLEKKSDFHFVFLQEIDAMWPVKNREIVFESIVSRAGPSQILVEMKSVNHPKAPKNSNVRAKVYIHKVQDRSIGRKSNAGNF